MVYEWYKNIQEVELQQGDFILDCPIVVPPKTLKQGDISDIEIKLMDIVILTQSCDLVQNKIEIVLVCPYYPLQYYISQMPASVTSGKGKQKCIDDLRKGNVNGYHLLNKNADLSDPADYLVVDFKNVYGIQFTALLDIVTERNKRTRLLPPYREHLSQAFARYFMRVGLPQDIKVEY
jgi:hypothetical protein